MKKRPWNITFDAWSLKRKVQLYSWLKKKFMLFNQLTYLFRQFLSAAGCYFDPWAAGLSWFGWSGKIGFPKTFVYTVVDML